MNNNFFRQNSYNPSYIPQESTAPPMISNNNDNMDTYKYTETIINENIGKTANVYMSFADSIEWRDRIFRGKIESAGRDYILLRDENNKQLLLWSIYINFIEFD